MLYQCNSPCCQALLLLYAKKNVYFLSFSNKRALLHATNPYANIFPTSFWPRSGQQLSLSACLGHQNFDDIRFVTHRLSNHENPHQPLRISQQRTGHIRISWLPFSKDTTDRLYNDELQQWCTTKKEQKNMLGNPLEIALRNLYFHSCPNNVQIKQSLGCSFAATIKIKYTQLVT